MIGNLLSDQPIAPKRTTSMVPPGMGELNYLQSLIAGITNQELNTTASPTFVGATFTGLTASLPIVTNASKALASVSYATFKASLAIAQADVAGLTTASSPSFAGLYLTGGTPAAAKVWTSTDGTGVGSWQAPTAGAHTLTDANNTTSGRTSGQILIATGATTYGWSPNTITLSGNTTLNDWFDQSVKQSASPTFKEVSLIITGGPFLYLKNSTSTTTSDALSGGIEFNQNFSGTYRAVATIAAYTDAASSGAGDAPGRLVFFTTPDGSTALAERMRITNAGLVGIGTGAPSYLLEVRNSGAANGSLLNLVGFLAGTDVTLGPVQLIFGLYPSATGSSRYASIAVVDGAAWRNLSLCTSGGRVGIGITSPTAMLQIASGGNTWTTSAWGRGIELPQGNVIKWTKGTNFAWGLGQSGDSLYFASSSADDNSAGVSSALVLKNSGTVNIPGLPVYANNVNALAGGLVAGDLYKTASTATAYVCVTNAT